MFFKASLLPNTIRTKLFIAFAITKATKLHYRKRCSSHENVRNSVFFAANNLKLCYSNLHKLITGWLKVLKEEYYLEYILSI